MGKKRDGWVKGSLFPKTGGRKTFGQMTPAERKAVRPPPEQESEEERPDGQQARREMEAAVKSLHRRLGHCEPTTLARMLRLGGATKEAQRVAKEYRCPTCERIRRPKTCQKTRPRKADDFREILCLDVSWIEDVDGEKWYFLSRTDAASTFQTARLLWSKATDEVVATMHEMWISHFGRPTKGVEYDQGSEFKGQFAALMDQLNTNSKVAALEAAWQNGTAEAHCATLRHMATRVIQHDNVRGYNELRVALSEALLAKNTQARCKGYSPLQWVLGYEESLPGSVLERPQDLAAHSMALDEEGPGAAFRRRLQMRETARKAWIEMDNSDRIRQALTRRPLQDTARVSVGVASK